MKNSPKKKILVISGMLIVLFIAGCENHLENISAETAPEQENQIGYVPEKGFVPTESVAVKIATAVLHEIYGDDIYNETPFEVSLENDSIWKINGILPEKHIGGVAHIEIRKSDGKILKVMHGK